MSDPIADPSDLGTYLGDSGINEDRATLILQMAQSLCESVVSPLTAAALPVILDVAARAYSNATSAQSVGIGTGHVAFGTGGPIGGLYLSKANQATLRRLMGRSSAFSIDYLPADYGPQLAPWDTGALWLSEGFDAGPV